MGFIYGALCGVAVSAALAVWFHRRQIREKIKSERESIEAQFEKRLAEEKAKLKARL